MFASENGQRGAARGPILASTMRAPESARAREDAMDDRSIDYDIVECAMGQLLVAATARGVCNVRLGDAAGPLEEGLRAEFPFAVLRRGRTRLSPWIAALRALLAGCELPAEVPLDVRPSQFQRRVWQVLVAIPRGETRGYSGVAEAIGQPRAARAVARACATNPVAVLIPCHRVVGKDGEAGGYRWGAARKRALLGAETGKESDLSLSDPSASVAGCRRNPRPSAASMSPRPAQGARPRRGASPT